MTDVRAAIEAEVRAVADSLDKDDVPNAAAKEALLKLASRLIDDLHRIADAVETIARAVSAPTIKET